MIKNFRGTVDGQTLKAVKESLEKYFHENTEILESFQFLYGNIAQILSRPRTVKDLHTKD
jgi:hypothetical protein